jgi:hypothetical protein
VGALFALLIFSKNRSIHRLVVGVLAALDYFLHTLERQHTDDRAENLIFGDDHVVPDTAEVGGLDEGPPVAVASAASQRFRTLFPAAVRVA